MERTFNHSHKGELHGITVVVEARESQLFVGRCDTLTAEAIVLLDADVHKEGQEGHSNKEFLEQVSKFGHWSRHARIVVPREDILSVRRLGEISLES